MRAGSQATGAAPAITRSAPSGRAAGSMVDGWGATLSIASTATPDHQRHEHQRPDHARDRAAGAGRRRRLAGFVRGFPSVSMGRRCLVHAASLWPTDRSACRTRSVRRAGRRPGPWPYHVDDRHDSRLAPTRPEAAHGGRERSWHDTSGRACTASRWNRTRCCGSWAAQAAWSSAPMPTIEELYRASYEPSTPDVTLETDRVTVRYALHRFLGRLSTTTETTSRFALSTRQPWDIAAPDGVTTLDADLADVRILGLKVGHGGGAVKLRLGATRRHGVRGHRWRIERGHRVPPGRHHGPRVDPGRRGAGGRGRRPCHRAAVGSTSVEPPGYALSGRPIRHHGQRRLRLPAGVHGTLDPGRGLSCWSGRSRSWPDAAGARGRGRPRYRLFAIRERAGLPGAAIGSPGRLGTDDVSSWTCRSVGLEPRMGPRTNPGCRSRSLIVKSRHPDEGRWLRAAQRRSHGSASAGDCVSGVATQERGRLIGRRDLLRGRQVLAVVARVVGEVVDQRPKGIDPCQLTLLDGRPSRGRPGAAINAARCSRHRSASPMAVAHAGSADSRSRLVTPTASALAASAHTRHAGARTRLLGAPATRQAAWRPGQHAAPAAGRA